MLEEKRGEDELEVKLNEMLEKKLNGILETKLNDILEKKLNDALEAKLNVIIEEKLEETSEENAKVQLELKEAKSMLDDICIILAQNNIGTDTDDTNDKDEESDRALPLQSFSFRRIPFRNSSLIRKSVVEHNQADGSEFPFSKSLALDYGSTEEEDNNEPYPVTASPVVEPQNFLARFLRTTHKIMKTNIELENTNTIHMYCAALHYPRNGEAFTFSEKAKALSYSSFSLMIFIFQIWALVFVVWEAVYPSCANNQDCNAGLFCGWEDLFDSPRCSDCGWMNTEVYYNSCNKVHEVLSNQSWDMDYSTFWLESTDSGINRHINSDVREVLDNYSNITEESHFGSDSCLNYHHCEAGKLANWSYHSYSASSGDPVCPFMKLNTQMLTVDKLIILFFLSLLFTVSLLSNMEQAITEKAVLERIIRRLRRKKISVPFCAYVNLAMIRANAYILPWYIASVTVSNTVTDTISIKNLVLNFLAVLFIADTDDLIGYLIVTQKEMLHVERVVQLVKDDESDFSVNFGWVRASGIIISVSMFAVISIFEQITTKIFFAQIDMCANIPHAIITLFWKYLPSMNVIFLEAFWFFVFSRKSRVSVYRAVKEVIKNMVSLFLVSMLSTLAYIMIMNSDVWGIYMYAYFLVGLEIFNLFIFMIAAARVRQIRRHGWKNRFFLLDTILAGTCCACFYYYLTSPVALATWEEPQGIRTLFV